MLSILVGTMTQLRMGVGCITFLRMGPRRGQYAFLMSKSRKVDISWERAGLLAFRLCVLLDAVLIFFLFLSRMVSGEGSGIRQYRFLIIVFSSFFFDR